MCPIPDSHALRKGKNGQKSQSGQIGSPDAFVRALRGAFKKMTADGWNEGLLSKVSETTNAKNGPRNTTLQNNGVAL